MESLANVQEATMATIVKTRANFKKAPKDRLTINYMESRLENLEQQWQLFFKTHVEIISNVSKTDLLASTYHSQNIFDEVEEIYTDFKSELKRQIARLQPPTEHLSSSLGARSSAPMSNVKLPEIKIPHFSGKYIEWQTFRDLFLGLIHNNSSINDAQKMYYLKSHLSGDAEQLLRNITVTSDNYISSWEKIVAMYNNKRFLANNILKRLLAQRNMMFESAHELKKLVSTTSDCLESIKTLGIDVSSWDILIIHVISAKLDKETRKAWELSVSSDGSDELPTYKQFTDFLVGRFRGLENLDTRSTHTEKGPRNSQSFHVQHEICCAFCSGTHKITFCTKFSKQSTETRRDFAQNNGLCFVCLYSNHSAKECKSNFKCHLCKRRHHTLLHPKNFQSVGEGSTASHGSAAIAEGEKVEANKNIVVERSTEQPVVSCMSTGKCGKTVLLTTALVKAKTRNGTYQVVRALLDQGSQGSFVTESTVQYLRLMKKSAKHTVTGVGGNNSFISKSTVTLQLQSRMDPSFSIEVVAYVLGSITCLLPAVKTGVVEWLSLSNDDLADPQYHTPNKIDVLLGAEVYSQVVKAGIMRSADGRLLAQDTSLGWIISGVVDTESPPSAESFSSITVMHTHLQTDELLRKFWELEGEPAVNKKMLTAEEKKCEELFTTTTSRDDTGRYVVRLPFKDNDRSCLNGESRKIAERRNKNLDLYNK